MSPDRGATLLPHAATAAAAAANATTPRLPTLVTNKDGLTTVRENDDVIAAPDRLSNQIQSFMSRTDPTRAQASRAFSVARDSDFDR